jgi:hypothetical protein
MTMLFDYFGSISMTEDFLQEEEEDNLKKSEFFEFLSLP